MIGKILVSGAAVAYKTRTDQALPSARGSPRVCAGAHARASRWIFETPSFVKFGV